MGQLKTYNYGVLSGRNISISCIVLFILVMVAGRAVGQAESPLTIPVWRGGLVQTVTLPNDAPYAGPIERVKALVAATIDAGSLDRERSAGYGSMLPGGVKLVEVLERGQGAVVRLEFPEGALLDEVAHDAFQRALGFWAVESGLGFLGVEARRAGSESDDYLPLDRFLPELPPIVRKNADDDAIDAQQAEEGVDTRSAFFQQGQAQPQGALSGASVFISAGHGWFYSNTNNRWETQRFNSNGIVEDHSNAEAVNQYLLQYLWNAGARVYPMRERCMNRNMVIVQNQGAGYSETGTWSTQTGTGMYGGQQRVATTVTGAATATATFTPTIPADGYYAVYAWYRTTTTGTTSTDARYTIRHSGGQTTWVQNQARDGFTWKYLGTYYFLAGTNSATGSVVLDNASATAGNRVMAGAVRFGGGMGITPHPSIGTVSPFPRFEEASMYHSTFMGFTNAISAGTVSSIPRYAEWELETWERGTAVYVSWHTNAFNGNSRGTETYAYSSAGFGGAFNGVAGSDVLRNFIQNELINDIRAGWDPAWTNRGARTANFGEINPNNIPNMPSALTEIAFHDNPIDAAAILNPRFRMLAARAVYQGIVKFYASSSMPNFNNSTLLPEPPTNLRVENVGNNTVRLSWQAPPFNSGNGLLGDAATGYRVYRSRNGYGFDNGINNVTTSYTVGGLEPGGLYFFRVSATNAGGESFPTETLAVRVRAETGRPEVLLVNGFDRLDGGLNLLEADPFGTGQVQRGFLDRMNSFNYSIAHARALVAAGVAFDSTSNEAVIAGAVPLNGYDAVVWILGRESTADSTFNATERTLVSSYLAGGGSLFVSGSEIAWDLDQQNNGRTFFRDVLRAQFAADSANSYFFRGSGHPQGFVNNLTGSFDSRTTVYDVTSPDVLLPINGSFPLLSYVGRATFSDFETLGTWWQPSASGSTTADPSSSLALASSPVYAGASSGRLNYVWGSGAFIRLVNNGGAALDFPASSDLSVWVFGDNSGHRVRLCVRDLADNELFTNPPMVLDFTGWRELRWNNIANSPNTRFAGSGDGVITGPTLRFDSIQLVRDAGGPATGSVFFDDLMVESGEAGTAAIAYGAGPGRVVVMGFPFETIVNEATRNELMRTSMEFLMPSSISQFVGVWLR